MPSFVVTGASRGLGLEFVRQLSSDSDNVVIGLVRDKKATEKQFDSGLPKNLTVLQADITDVQALKIAAESIAKLTGGQLDFLINNAGLVSRTSQFSTLGDFDDNPETLFDDLQQSFSVNVVGVIKTTNIFLPLLRKGREKKIITLTTGLAEMELTNQFELAIAAPYSISKAAVNLAMAKYNALYKQEGMLFMAISPGFVDTGDNVPTTEEGMKGLQAMASKFAAYAPDFKGPMTPEDSVHAVLDVLRDASVEKGDGGAFVSHLGNKQWL